MAFIGKMSLLLTANYGQLTTALTAVQASARMAGQAVAGVGAVANSSLTGTLPLLGRFAQGLLGAASGAGSLSGALQQVGQAFREAAAEREKLAKKSLSVPSVVPVVSAGIAGGVIGAKGVAQATAAQVALGQRIQIEAAKKLAAMAPPPAIPTPSRFTPPFTQAALAAQRAAPATRPLRGPMPPDTGLGNVHDVQAQVAAAAAHAAAVEAEQRRIMGLRPPKPGTPPPAKGMVRMYQGGGGDWFSPDINYAKNGPWGSNGKLNYVDLPHGHPELQKSFDDTGTSMTAPYVAFKGSEAVNKLKQPFVEEDPGDKLRQNARGARAAKRQAEANVLEQAQIAKRVADAQQIAEAHRQHMAFAYEKQNRVQTNRENLEHNRHFMASFAAQGTSVEGVAAGALQMAAAAQMREAAKKAGTEQGGGLYGGMAMRMASSRSPLLKATAESAVLDAQEKEMRDVLREIRNAPRIAAKKYRRARDAAREAEPWEKPELESLAQLRLMDYERKKQAAQEAKSLFAAGGGGVIPPGIGGAAEGAGAGAAAGGFMGMSGGALLGIGAAAIGLGLVTRAGTDFELQMTKVRGLTNATAGEFGLLSHRAIEMGQTTFFSATEAARGMQDFARAGFSVKQIMELMPAVTAAATAGNADLTVAIKAATTMSQNFGMGIEDTRHFLDVAGYAASKAGVGFGEFSEGMMMSMSVLKAAGQSVEEMAAGLQVLNQKGLAGSTAGTLLRNIAKKTVDSSSEALVAMRALGITAVDPLTGKAKGFAQFAKEFREATKGLGAGVQLQLAEKFVETRAAPGFLAAVNDIQALDKALRDITEHNDQWNKKQEAMQLDTVAGQWKQFKGAIDSVALSLWEVVNGPLKYTLMGFKHLGNFLGGQHGDFGKVAGGVIGGAGAGAGIGALIGLLTKLTPWGRAASTIGALTKTGAVAGGVWGGVKSLLGLGEEGPPRAFRYEQQLERSRKISETMGEVGQGADVVSIMKLSKALIELTYSIRDNIAATRAAAQISSEHFGIQAGGVEVVKRMAEAYKAEHREFGNMEDIRKQQAQLNQEIQPLHRFQEVVGGHKGMVEQMEERKRLFNEDKNAFEKHMEDVAKYRKLLYGTDPRSPSLRVRHQAALEGLSKDDMVDKIAKRLGVDEKGNFFTDNFWGGVTEQIEQARKLQKTIGYLREAEKAAASPDVVKSVIQRSAKSLAQQAAGKQEDLDAILEGPVMKRFREAFPKLGEAMAQSMKTDTLQGQIELLERLGSRSEDVARLTAQLRELRATEDNLSSAKFRMREVEQAANIDQAPPAIQNMIIQRELTRSSVIQNLQSRKQLAEAEAELRRLQREGAPEVVLQSQRKQIEGVPASTFEGPFGLPIATPARPGLRQQVLIDEQAAVYGKHLENIKKTHSDVMRPKEIFAAQAGALMGELAIPGDLQDQIARAQETVAAAQKATGPDAPGNLKLANQQLNSLMGDLENATQKWDRYERAVRKAGQAMDEAMGGARLPTTFLEGSAAAVSRINQYGMETDPNRAVLTSILDELVQARILYEQQLEVARDIRAKTPQEAPGKPKPFLK